MALGSQTPEVTIIGAGIVGICCALSALEQGMSVRLVDRAPPAEGASYGNAGVISPWSCVPQSMPGLWKHVPRWLIDPEGPVSIRLAYLPRFAPWVLRFLNAGQPDRVTAIADAMESLSRPNVELYRHHLAGTGHEDLVRDAWYLHVYRDPAQARLDDFAWQLRSRHQAPVERLDAAALREVEPAISSEYKAAIVIKQQARAMSPGRLGKVLAEKAQRIGAEILQASVHEIRPASQTGGVLVTDQGSLAYDRLVLAAGAWSVKLLQPLGIDLPLEAERGYHLVFPDPGVSLSHSVMDVAGKFVISSMEQGMRCAGTAEFAGLEAAPNYHRARVFERLSKRLIPDLTVAGAREWMGVRPSFPDSLPCIGPIPGHPAILAAFGHSHYGLGMAPATGRVIGELVSGASPSIDLSPYRPQRFG